MKPGIFIVIIIFSQLALCAQQREPISQSEKFVDFLTIHNTVIGLTSSGHIITLRLEKDQQSRYLADSGVKAITVSPGGKLISLNGQKQIIASDLDGNNRLVLASLGYSAYQVVFDTKGEMYTISAHGIQKVGTKTFYLPDTSYNKLIQQVTPGWSSKPNVHMASDDRLWISLNHGEWGGEIFIFDTKTAKFSLPEMDSLKMLQRAVRAFAGNGHEVIMGMGGARYIAYAAIVESDGENSRVLYSYWHKFDDEKVTREEIIENDLKFSSAVINPVDKKLYLSNSNGIYAAERTGEKAENITLTHISKSRFLINGQTGKFSNDLQVKKLGAIVTGELVLMDIRGRLFVCDQGIIRPVIMN